MQPWTRTRMALSPRKILSAVLPTSAQLRLPSFQKCPPFASLQVEACFKKFDKDKDGMLNFVEFKNFMGKRKSLPDKVTIDRFFLKKKFLIAGTGPLHLHLVPEVSTATILPYIPLYTLVNIIVIVLHHDHLKVSWQCSSVLLFPVSGNAAQIRRHYRVISIQCLEETLVGNWH